MMLADIKNALKVEGAPLLGAMTYWTITTGARKTTLAQYRDACRQAGLVTALQKDPPPRHYFSYAWEHIKQALEQRDQSNERVFTLRFQQEDQKQSVVLVVEQTKDKLRKWSDFQVVDRIILDKPTGQVTCDQGHKLATQVIDAYHAWRGYPTYDLIRKEILADLASFQAIRLRQTGGLYFILAHYYDQWMKRAKVLADTGLATVYDIPVYDVAGSKKALQDGARQSLADELEALKRAIKDFTADTRPKALARRLQDFQTLKAKVAAYEAALGLALDELKAEMNKATNRLQTLVGGV